MRNLKLTAVSALALLALAGPALADGFWSSPGGKGYFLAGSPRQCVGAPETSPRGCAYLAILDYRADGSAVAYTTTGYDQSSTYYTGTLREGAGKVEFTWATPLAGTVAFNGGQSAEITRFAIVEGRPGASFFNAIQTGLYTTEGGTAPTWMFEVQGSKLFAARIVNGSWQIAVGDLTVNPNATSSFTGSLLSFRSNGTSSSAGNVSIQFPLNNKAVVTLPDGSVETVLQLAF